MKLLRLACRHFCHVKRRAKAKKALKRLRTIAGILMWRSVRNLPDSVLEQEADRFALYQRVIDQRRTDKNKVYSLHESDVYCVGKGKDHKQYEHDSKILKVALDWAKQYRDKPIKMAVVDRGAKKYIDDDIEILLPSPPLKRDTAYQRQKKRKLCRRRAAIVPIIGHLKHDYRQSRNWLKGSKGDAINLHMATCAWNLRKWLIAFLCSKMTNWLGSYYCKYAQQRRQSPVGSIGPPVMSAEHPN